MTLAAHQKVVVELASINSRVGDVLDRLRKMSAHDHVEVAIAELEKIRGPISRAHDKLSSLPPTYSPHASKMPVKDITIGATVAVRETQRKKYLTLLTAEDMGYLKVVTVGPSCGVETRAGVRLLITRGHLVTAEAPSVDM